MQAHVFAYLNGKQDLCVPISELTTIGRDADNGVQLPHPQVSAHHALLRHTGEGWRIWDRDSRNGVFVNGTKVEDATLKDGDEISVGPYILRVEAEGGNRPLTPRICIDTSEDASKRTLAAKLK